MIHAIVNNDDVNAFLCRYNIPSGRLAIKNCKSENRYLTVWEMVVELWNNLEFTLITKELGDLHSDFLVEEEISFDHVKDMTSATPEKCEDKLNSMMVQMNHVITNWERSGQGDDGINVTEEDKGGEGGSIHEFGSLKNHNCHVLDQ